MPKIILSPAPDGTTNVVMGGVRLNQKVHTVSIDFENGIGTAYFECEITPETIEADVEHVVFTPNEDTRFEIFLQQLSQINVDVLISIMIDAQTMGEATSENLQNLLRAWRLENVNNDGTKPEVCDSDFPTLL